ncbi:MAG: chemotaxis response regulator protein-glutamate methylesterase [Nitrospirae bacterium]|nr:chemotaxis response regulator protein-glutamate methylesterase [Nitrospirota bacterium]
MKPSDSAKRTRILVVDDSATSRQAVRRIVDSVSRFEVIGTATNGKEAITRLMRLKPDIVLLDIEMPEMDGFAFLRWMLANEPVPVIVVSSRTDSASVFRCLDLGAVDFVAKPLSDSTEHQGAMARDLIMKLDAMTEIGMEKVKRRIALTAETARVRFPGPSLSSTAVEAVAIGASTGGPSALQMILSAFPADFAPAVLVSQHMPQGFTRSFADRLNKICALRIAEACDGDLVEPGRVYIAPGDRNITMSRLGDTVILKLLAPPSNDLYVPSVDVMMAHVARAYGRRAVGVLLTGMGNDGSAGMLEIMNEGGYTIAESEETAVVFGMPREAIAAGAVKKVLPLEEIPKEVMRYCSASAMRKNSGESVSSRFHENGYG